MRRALHLASLVLVAGAIACSRDANGPRALRGTLRRVAVTEAAPAWLEDAVCARAPDLAPRCEGVALAIHEEARAALLDPVLVLAIIEVESGWDPRAVSHRGARGLMQLLGPTAAGEARRARLASLDPHHPIDAVRGGVRYFARLARIFGDGDLALVAYNAGPNRLRRHLAAGALPARFLVYPRRVRAEAKRLRAALGAPREALALAGPDRATTVGN